ncbi:sensor histidine kinase [Oceanobacillus halophilus]|uniref:histidine kinase n=1 Tax=Oceanobacillus halophilus TaxID=930130 RepID=A0A494ZW85_9BACI|nr:HAMP domain-containing sensor histidine kinase [Oceanobacillus halophilus]RKQ30895.1 sensor histidine kinase [Oceanobacillus halophilus]
MKLQSQLSIAFTSLLLVIMTIVWYVIYSLILSLLIQDEQRQLEQTGEILVDILNEQYSSSNNIQQFYKVLEDQDLQLFLYDRNRDSVLFSTMATPVVQGFYENNDFANTNDSLWNYGNEKYVTSRILFLPELSGIELILLTPLDDLKVVQQNFFLRLFLIFLIGISIAVLLAYYFTRKLVTPLSQLKRQLKKIEKRQFDNIEHIKATGEIKEVADSVYDMARELQRYMNSQQTFFQNASHELKTPLMTIQGYAEGIKDGIFDKAETEKGLEVMVTEVNRLKGIINEMILLAKLDTEPTAYEPKEVKAKELIELVVDRALPLVNEKGIALNQQVENNIKIFADEEKLLRALLNVVFNGIRHAQTQVNIEATNYNGWTTIIVEDDGTGISEEIAPNIFHRFVKGKDGETGLGLAIARAIIEHSNGKIVVTQSLLGGAKFVITLPENKD